jgi:IclR family acetate operon transcriptional repressor
LLSQLDPAAFELLLKDIADGPEAEAVRAAVAEVRERGYAESVNQSVAGVHGIAVPVGDDPGLGCVSVSGPSSRFDDAAVAVALPQLRDTAEALLGMRAPVPG